MKTTIFNDDVYYFTDIVSNEDKDYILSAIEEESGWVRVYNDGHEYNPDRDPDADKSQSCMIAYRKYFRDEAYVLKPGYEKISEIIDRIFKETTAAYRKGMNFFYGNEIPPFGVMDKHMEGTVYQPHVDTAPVGLESYTVLLYVNDDYDGGEISFMKPERASGIAVRNGILSVGPKGTYHPEHPKNKDIVDFWIKPEAMSVVIFPPLKPYPHTAHEVTNGTKYLVKAFWQVTDSIPDSWSSSPYEGRDEDEIARVNPEGFLINGYQHELIKSGKQIVPNEYKHGKI